MSRNDESSRPRLNSKASKKASTNDLRQQFSDLQHIFGVGKKENVMPNEIVYPPLPQNAEMPATFMKKQRSRNSESSENQLASHRASALPAAPAKSMNFLSDLSDNLLVECRKLTAENKKLKQDYEDKGREIEVMATQISNITLLNKKLSEQEEKLKDDAWELQAELQRLRDDMGQRTSEMSKLSRGKLENDSELQNLRNQVEEYRLSHDGLKHEMQSASQRLELEIKELKQRNIDLNEENEELHNKVVRLNDDLKISKETSQTPGRWAGVPKLAPDSSFEDSGDFDDDYALLTEPPSSPVKQVQGRNFELEKETVQANLVHANKLISKLRSSALKYKNERDQLKRQFKERPAVANTKVKPVHITKDSRKRGQPGILSKLGNKSHTSYETSQTDEGDDSWENYDISTATRSTFEKVKSASTSKSERDLPDSDSNSDSDLPGMILADEISDLSDVEDDLQLSVLDQKAVEQYASDHGLVILPYDEFKRLQSFDAEKSVSSEQQDDSMVQAAKEFNILALPNTTNHPVQTVDSVEELVQKCRNRGLVALRESHYEELKLKVDHVATEQELIQMVEQRGLTVLPTSDFLQMKSLSEKPSPEFITIKAQDMDMQVLSNAELESLKHPSVAQLETLAQEKQMVMVPQDVFADLKTTVAQPSENHLTLKAGALGMSLIPINEYTKLTSFFKKPSLEKSLAVVQSEGYEPIKSEKLQKLTEKANHSPSVEEITQNLKLKGMQVISSEGLAELKRKAETPSKEELVAAASSLGLGVCSKAISEILVSPAKAIIEKAKDHGLIAITQEDFDAIVNPAKSKIESLASSRGMVALEKDTHDKLVDASLNPTKELILEHSESHGLVSVPASDYTQLAETVKSPSKEFLTKKAGEAGMVLLSSDEHEKIIKQSEEPSEETIKRQSQKLGIVLLPTEEHESLVKNSSTPSFEHIKQVAQKVGLVVVPEGEYKNLAETSASPSKDFLIERLHSLGLEVLQSAELENLRSPDLSFISEAASKHGYVNVPKAEFSELNRKTLSPSKDELNQLANSQGFVALPALEYDALKESALHPSKETVVNSLGALGLVEMTKKEHDALKSQVKSPSLEFLTNALKSRGLVSVEEKQLNILKENMASPDEEFLKSQAASLNLSVVPIAQLNALKENVDHPSVAFLTERASAIGYSVLPKDQLEELKETSRNAINRSPMKTPPKSTGIGVSVPTAVPVPVFNSSPLSRKRNQPAFETVDELKKKCADQGLVVLSKSSYEGLIVSSKRGLTFVELREKIQQHGYVAISQKDFDSMKSPNVEFSSEFLRSQGYAVIPKEEYMALINELKSPTMDYLSEKVKPYNRVIVKKSDHDALLNASTELSNIKAAPKVITKEEILDEASNHELKALPQSEFSELKAMIDSPSRDWVVSQAHKIQLVAVEENEYATLKDLVEHPSMDTVRSEATLNDFIVIKKEEFEKIEDKASDLTLEQLKPLALKLDHVCIQRDTFDSISEASKQPSIDLIRKRADQLGLVLLTKEEHSSLLGSITNPTLKYLQEKALGLDMVVVHKDAYDNLLNPSKEQLIEKSHDAGMVTLANEEYQELTQPSRETLQHLAEKSQLVVLDTTEHHKLLNPTPDFLTRKAHDLDLVTLSSSEHKELSNPSKERVVTFAKSHGLVSVETSEYEKLKSPSREDIEHEAKSMGLIAIELSEYEQLFKPSAETIRSLAPKFGIVPLSASEHEGLLNDISFPSKEYVISKADSHEMVALDKDELESLKRKISNPSLEFLVTACDEMGLVVLNSADHSKMLTDLQHPSKELITSEAPVHGLRVVEAEELQRLQRIEIESSKNISPAVLDEESLRKLAGKLDLALITEVEYSDLLKRKAVETKEDLEVEAKRLGFDLVPELNTQSFPPSPVKSFYTVASEEFHDAVDHFDLSEQPSRNSVYVDAVSTQETDVRSALTKEDINEDWLRARALSFGYRLAPLDEELSGDETSIEDMTAQRVTVTSGRLSGELRSPSIEEIKRFANEAGYDVLSRPEVDRLKALKEHNDIVDIKLLEHSAANLGCVIINKDELSMLKSKSAANSSDDSKANLELLASKLGLVVTTPAALDKLKSRNVTTQDLAAKAAELNLKLVSADEIAITESSMRTFAVSKGFLLIPKSAYIATTVAKEPDVDKVVAVPATYYNKLVRSHTWYKNSSGKGDEISPQSPEKPVGVSLHNRGISNAGDSIIEPPKSLDRLLQSTSANSIHSQISIGTEISFTDKVMVSAITQTMIGEYLYKYYRRLGPLSSISENRHERYFWVHPYSMTLYWSTVNPVLGNPSDNKIRAAAILGVESVDDNNPLPVGLYHKSILIHCSERTIRVTCPTRQRHNIWYNSLRYLIHKSVDGADDKDEDQYDLSYQLDQKTEIERSMTFRHSQPRKSVLGYRTSSNPIPRSVTNQSILSSMMSNTK
ncbi:unnamed protein product [Kuraishia capsulata CBS 1993]|uniref:PH domain-containing protein n=1 Tax=Kuraishia capsulata CBS 1993 TaxID=1382522 RepID=W6MKK5_9ASCO|nr:uncharacterized protein KUCA_T00002893001 [Kuraishia capsulata CBS 1993]CDK26916.1 unnamed protein product [Kuraishia capsulata CBS 1993]